MAGTHPKVVRAGLGNVSADDELESLLREQEAFRQSGGTKLGGSTSVRRAEKSGNTNSTKKQSTGQSLFKQRRAAAGATSAEGHPELSALPDAQAPSGDKLPCLAEAVAERPPANLAENSSFGALRAAPPSGFPVANHRAFGKHLGRPQRDPGVAAQSGGATPQEQQEGEETDEEDSISKENAERLAQASADEILQWQQELLKHLGAETCEFLRRRGQEKEKLRGRGGGDVNGGAGGGGSGKTVEEQAHSDAGPSAGRGTGKKVRVVEEAGEDFNDDNAWCPSSSSTSKPAPQRSQLLGVDLLQSLQGAGGLEGGGTLEKQLAEAFPKQSASADGSSQGGSMLQALAAGFLDPAEARKLQWTMPAAPADVEAILADESLPPETVGKIIQLLRFDFEGRICLRIPTSSDENDGENDNDRWDRAEGLHHHGAEAAQAGYTLAELLLLSRSSHPPQRALALNTLARVLLRARVPVGAGSLKSDPALRRLLDELRSAAKSHKDAPTSATCADVAAGFSVGSSAFFWHGLSRSDMPKHIAEGLQDTSLAVQVGALYAALALLDGGVLSQQELLRAGLEEDAAVAAAAATSSHSVREAGPPPQNRQSIFDVYMKDRSRGGLACLLAGPLEIAGELLWPDSPPRHLERLTTRSRVAVFLPEDAGKGGLASFPHLLRKMFLRAQDASEVTADDVLDPLRPHWKPEPDEDAEAAQDGTLSCKPFLSSLVQLLEKDAATSGPHHNLSALVMRLLSLLCSYSAVDCAIILNSCKTWSKTWRQRLATLPLTGFKLEYLRFLRRSCESSGLSAADWWLSHEPDEDREKNAGFKLVETLRHSIQDALDSIVDDHAADSTSTASSSTMGTSDLRLSCGIEAMRVWIAWLVCGAGVDMDQEVWDTILKSWFELLGRWLVDHSGLLPGRATRHADLLSFTCLILRFLQHLLRLRQRASNQLPGSTSGPLGGLASVYDIDISALLLKLVSPLTSLVQKALLPLGAIKGSQPLPLEIDVLRDHCLADAFALCSAVVAASKVAGSELVAECASGYSELAASALQPVALESMTAPVVTSHASWDDEEAPWPLGCVAAGRLAADLARLRLLRAVCSVAVALATEEQKVDEGTEQAKPKQTRSSVDEVCVVPWLEALESGCLDALRQLVPEISSSVGSGEALVGRVCCDAWPGLLGQVWQAMRRLPSSKSPAFEQDPHVMAVAMSLCSSTTTAKELLALLQGHPLPVSAELPLALAAYFPAMTWREPKTETVLERPYLLTGPPTMSFPTSLFWTLTTSPPVQGVKALLGCLATEASKVVALAVPPWLPFVAFMALISAPLAGGSWAWADSELLPLLEGYASQHLVEPPPWLPVDLEWLAETLRGICDRVAKVFLEESFGSKLVLQAMWAFAAEGMPSECREVCSGHQDPAVVALLLRASGPHMALLQEENLLILPSTPRHPAAIEAVREKDRSSSARSPCIATACGGVSGPGTSRLDTLD